MRPYQEYVFREAARSDSSVETFLHRRAEQVARTHHFVWFYRNYRNPSEYYVDSTAFILIHASISESDSVPGRRSFHSVNEQRMLCSEAKALHCCRQQHNILLENNILFYCLLRKLIAAAKGRVHAINCIELDCTTHDRT
jgi:hypothetical protein